MSIPQNPEDFFLTWLPSAFEGVASREATSSSTTTAAGSDSIGSLTFWVGELAPFTARLRRGALSVERSLPEDCIAQVSMGEADFEPILVRGVEALLGQNSPERQLSVLRALSLDAERVALIRGVPGSVAFVLTGGAIEHRIVLTPGPRPRPAGATECTVRCALNDFLAMQRGAANPFELMMNGRLQISGDAQIPMALSSLLM